MLELLFFHFLVAMVVVALGLAIPQWVLYFLAAYALWWVMNVDWMVRRKRAQR